MKKSFFGVMVALMTSVAMAQTPVVTTNGTDNALRSGYENCVHALGGFPHADCNVQAPREMPVKPPVVQPVQYKTETVTQRKHLSADTLFAFDSANLSEKGQGLVKELATEFLSDRNPKNARFKVIGHTDSMGSAAYNQKLSEKRAVTVATMLKQYGVPNVSHAGAGESDLLTSDCDVKYPKTKKGTKQHAEKIACHQESRRVEAIGEWEVEKTETVPVK